MSRVIRGMCAAGAVCLVLGGCTIPEQFRLSIFESSTGGNDRVVTGSVESVAASTQSGLRRLGMSGTITPQGEDLRMAVRTPLGDQFTLVFTRVKTADGEKTRVRIQGASGDHEQAVVRVLSEVDVVK